MILHSIRKVHRGTSPAWLDGTLSDARLNFTFRCAPDAIGREATDFQYYIPGQHRSKGDGGGGYGGGGGGGGSSGAHV